MKQVLTIAGSDSGGGAGLWLLYGVYESLRYARTLCSGECNIRVDLLLIYPILLIVTIAACVRAIRTPRVRQ